jgi:hypothetical protein
MDATIKIIRHADPTPSGKLADAEIHFSGGELDGLKLTGFAVWARRDGNGQNVTFPARQYTVEGDRRSFLLLRAVEDVAALDHLRDLVLRAFLTHDRDSQVEAPNR